MDEKIKVKRSFQYYMREIHRVVGYLVLGMVLVYAFGGVMLIFRTTDFMKHTSTVEQVLQPGMDANQLGAALKMKNFRVEDESSDMVYFAGGEYDKVSGVAVYENKEFVDPFNRFIDLHKLPFTKSPAIGVFTTLFGIALFLMAVTALFMTKPASRQFVSNMTFTALGVIAVILLLIFA